MPPTGPRKLSAEEVDLVNFAEEYYHEKGEFPPIQTLSTQLLLTPQRITDHLNKPKVKDALERRGLPRTSSPSNRLTGEQMAAISLVLDFSDPRPLKTKLSALGLSVTKWNAWQKSPRFRNYLNERAEELLIANKHTVLTGLTSSAASGDVSAIKLYLELTGRYNPKSQSEMHLQKIIETLLSVLQRRIDPILLSQIQEDFDAVMSGRNPHLPEIERPAVAVGYFDKPTPAQLEQDEAVAPVQPNVMNVQPR
jgi:hypothetical protein